MARELLQWISCCFVAFALLSVSAEAAPIHEGSSEISCMIPVGNIDTGAIDQMLAVPGVGVLIQAEKGLFLAHGVNGALAVEPVGNAVTGDVRHKLLDVPGVGVLIGAQKGWFLAHGVNGALAVEPAGNAYTDQVFETLAVPGVGVLIGADKGLFLAHSVNGALAVETADNAVTGAVYLVLAVPGVGVLIGANKGLFLAHSVNGALDVKPAGNADTGAVFRLLDVPGVGVLIRAEKGLFLARGVNGALTVERTANVHARDVLSALDVPGVGVLIGAEGDEGLFLARSVNGAPTVEPAGNADTGAVTQMLDVPGVGVLIGAEKGLFLTRHVNGALAVEPAGNAVTGYVTKMLAVPGVGVLIWASKGLFLARRFNAVLDVEPAGDADTGEVHQMLDVLDVGVLIRAEKGLFLAHPVNGTLAVEPADNAATGEVLPTLDVPHIGVLIRTKKGLFRVVTTPLSTAGVDTQDKKSLDGSPIDLKRYLDLAFTVTHACALVASQLGLKVRVTAPEGQSAINPKLSVGQSQTIAELTLAQKIDRAGLWRFQIIATSGSSERLVGDAQTLNFVDSSAANSWLERWWKFLTGFVVFLLALTNVALFVAARRSAWAWRLATDDGWGTGVLRLATILLSHFPKAQLWILDLYFQRARARICEHEPRPFLPLPLKASDGGLQASDQALAPSWRGRRLWVQGGSGMGKTTLVQHFMDSYFRNWRRRSTRMQDGDASWSGLPRATFPPAARIVTILNGSWMRFWPHCRARTSHLLATPCSSDSWKAARSAWQSTD
jgi:hypothetical protein